MNYSLWHRYTVAEQCQKESAQQNWSELEEIYEDALETTDAKMLTPTELHRDICSVSSPREVSSLAECEGEVDLQRQQKKKKMHRNCQLPVPHSLLLSYTHLLNPLQHPCYLPWPATLRRFDRHYIYVYKVDLFVVKVVLCRGYSYLCIYLSLFFYLFIFLFFLSPSIYVFLAWQVPIKSMENRTWLFSHTGTHTNHQRNPIIDSDTPYGDWWRCPPHFFPYSSHSSSSNGEQTHTHQCRHCASAVCVGSGVCVSLVFSPPSFPRVFVSEAVSQVQKLLHYDQRTPSHASNLNVTCIQLRHTDSGLSTHT